MWARTTPGKSRPRRLEPRQLPPVSLRVVPEDVGVGVETRHLEVAVIGRQPTVHDCRDYDPAFAQREDARRLLPAVSRMALDGDLQEIVGHGPWRSLRES